MESRDEDVLDEYYEAYWEYYITDCDYYGIDFDKCDNLGYYIIWYLSTRCRYSSWLCFSNN